MRRARQDRQARARRFGHEALRRCLLVAAAAQLEQFDGVIQPDAVGVADDDGREMLVYPLTAEGHSVEQAPDGRAAVDAAATFHPDVILDIGMPGINGYAVAQTLRKTICLNSALPGPGIAASAICPEIQREVEGAIPEIAGVDGANCRDIR